MPRVQVVFLTSASKSRMHSTFRHSGICSVDILGWVRAFPGVMNQLRVYAETGTPGNRFQGACNATHAPAGSMVWADWACEGANARLNHIKLPGSSGSSSWQELLVKWHLSDQPQEVLRDRGTSRSMIDSSVVYLRWVISA